MGDIKLAGAAWSFVGTSLLESATIWRALGIESMDLLAIPGASLIWPWNTDTSRAGWTWTDAM